MAITYESCFIIHESLQTYISKYAPSCIAYKYGPIEKQRKIKKPYDFDLSQAVLTSALSLREPILKHASVNISNPNEAVTRF